MNHSRIPKDPAINCILYNHFLSELPVLSRNRLDSPVAEMRLRVSSPIFVATRSDDGRILGIDDLFTFLVGQIIDVWPRSATTIRQKRLA
jgi:hypothetical protein